MPIKIYKTFKISTKIFFLNEHLIKDYSIYRIHEIQMIAVNIYIYDAFKNNV